MYKMNCPDKENLFDFIRILSEQGITNMSITSLENGEFQLKWIKEPGEFIFKKPEEIIVHPVELPNGDIVWSQDAAEDEKILARWNKMME